MVCRRMRVQGVRGRGGAGYHLSHRHILFHKEKRYAPRSARVSSPLPQGYTGQFGPDQKSGPDVVLRWQMSEPKIADLFRSVGVHISEGISRTS